MRSILIRLGCGVAGVRRRSQYRTSGCAAALLLLLAGCVDPGVTNPPPRLQQLATRPQAVLPPNAAPAPDSVLAPAPVATVEAAPPPTEPPVAATPLPELPPAVPVAVPISPIPVRVAILLPLSGAQGQLGQALLRAAELALFEVGDERFVLLPRDTGGEPSGAVSAAEQALVDGAELILGPVFSAEVQAVAPVTRSRNVPMIAFSTDRSAAGQGVFLMGFMPDQQVLRVMSYAAGKGVRRFAALLPDTPYGMAVSAAMRRSARELGVEFHRSESYAPGAADVGEPIRRLAGAGGDAGYDALLIGEGGERLRFIGAQLPFHGIQPPQVRFLGTGLWDDPAVTREPALAGGWFAGPPPQDFAVFRERYQRMFNETPPRIATLAYDATALAAVLARTQVRANYALATLTNPSGFAGLDGVFRFGPDGIAERGLAVMEVQPEGFLVVSPSPPSFEPLTN